jgi:hypothetical protein
VDENIDSVKRRLANISQAWLLVFDNADDPKLGLAPYFPAGNRGDVIITSRNPQCQYYIVVCKRVCRLLGGQRRRAAPKSLSSAPHQILVSLQNYQFLLFGVFLKLNSPTETAYLTLIGTIG